MKVIDLTLLDKVLSEAKESPRLRKNIISTSPRTTSTTGF